jgi:hypothetical protein
MTISKEIKELSRFLVQQAKERTGDKEIRKALIDCGNRLSAQDQLLMIQAVGKAIVGYTEKELPAG